jgi:hypothetical protein
VTNPWRLLVYGAFAGLVSLFLLGSGPQQLPRRLLPDMNSVSQKAVLVDGTPTIAASGGVTATVTTTITLQGGQWANLADASNTKVFFTNVLEDTRCALNVDCFQAGGVRVLITVESGGKMARFDLSTKPADIRRIAAFNGYTFELIDFGPPRQSLESALSFSEYRATVRVSAASLRTSKAKLGEPFTLKLGQAADLANGDARLTFESVKQDSRCPSRGLCATSGSVTVVIAFQSQGSTDRYTFEADANAVLQHVIPGYVVRLNGLTPYPVSDFASKEITPVDYEATLVVASTVSPATPTPLTGCPDLTRGDAEEILAEPVKPGPAEMVLYQPAAGSISARGLCGYASVAFTPPGTAKNRPMVFPISIQSDHAVNAGKLTGDRRQEQLVTIATMIAAANPGAGGTLYNKLVTNYAAGGWSREALADFPNAAQGASNLTIKRVQELGDSAVWVWWSYDGGRYGALVALAGETLYVVSALTDNQRSPDGVLAAETLVVKRMLQK